ncbi:MAG: multiheme c-type cytochrome [Bryobacteraceae bacterium]|jgi:hypothetical protein
MKMRLILLFIAAIPALAAAPQAKYLGAGSCASSNCHGGTSAAAEQVRRTLGNEFATWSVSDKHAAAYKALEGPRARRMGEILKIASVAADKRCTVCHIAGSPEKTFSDGVACEACHGPAEQWLGTHTQPNSHADSVAKGMIDTKNLLVRAQTCLSCHLGAGDKFVDHELIAAGHPDLAFELDTFGWAQPAHYREPKPSAGNTLPRVRVWAVGQASALGEGMQLLAAHAAGRWPEFSDMECYQCHHDLRLESWRIQRGYAGRTPGSLQINQARYDVLRELVAQAAPGEREPLESSMSTLAEAMSRRPCDGQAVGQAARQVAKLAASLVVRLDKQDFDAAAARGLVKAIAANIQRIANSGVHSAEQAAMSLDSLTAAYEPSRPAEQNSITALYDYLEHPSAYQPGEFTALFRKAAATIQ